MIMDGGLFFYFIYFCLLLLRPAGSEFTAQMRGNVLKWTGSHVCTDYSFQVMTISRNTQPFSLE